jgi:hypothetical protein
MESQAMTTLETLERADFEAVRGRSARLVARDGELQVEVCEVTQLGGIGIGLRREPFSVVLVGPATPAGPQGTYRFEIEGWEPIELFVVPIGRAAAGGIRYEAIFT